MEKKNEEINQQPTNEGEEETASAAFRLQGDFHLKNLKHGEERMEGTAVGSNECPGEASNVKLS